MAEAYHEFVIQTTPTWLTPRPALEKLGAGFRVTLTDSVLPYEDIKIRILNATHTLIAWAGGLLNLRFIHDALAVPQIRSWCAEYITANVIPVLKPSGPPGFDLDGYRDLILARFSNPHLLDTCGRVAMDGYSKIPGQIAPTIRDRLAMAKEAGEPAAWILPTVRITALFLAFLKKLVDGMLAFPYVDSACDLDIVRVYLSSGDEVLAFARDPVLWTVAGEEGEDATSLAENPALVEALRISYAEVEAWIEESV
jgi:D-arabinitol 4-dehydrogenase